MRRGLRTKIPLLPTGETFQYIQIDHESLSTGRFESVTIEFDVSTAWLKAHGYDPGHVVLERYAGRWTSLPTMIVSQTGHVVTYQAISPGLSLFAVTAVGLMSLGLSFYFISAFQRVLQLE